MDLSKYVRTITGNALYYDRVVPKRPHHPTPYTPHPIPPAAPPAVASSACAPQVFYELFRARATLKRNDIAFLRIEQIAPFPFDHVASAIERYPNAEIVWAQEEPRNMGYWAYVAPRIRSASKVAGRELFPTYSGRLAAAAPAVGSVGLHEREVKAFIESTFE